MKGQKVSLPGHFNEPVVVEDVREIGSSYELLVRLSNGQLKEVVLSSEEYQSLSPEEVKPVGKLADAASLRLLIESQRIRLAYVHDPHFAVGLSGIRTLPHQIEAVYMRMLPQPRLRFLLADDPGAGKTIMAGLESSLRTLYTSVWLHPPEPGQALERVEATGRPLQATGIHERIMELLTQVTHKVYGTLLPRRIVELFRLGEASPEGSRPTLGVSVKYVVDAFFSSPGFPRLLSSDVITRTIVAGVEDQQFAYWGLGEPALDEDGKYKVPRDRVSIGTILQADEIDAEKGFLIYPSAHSL